MDGQMSDLMACIGRVQLARFDAEIRPARLALIAAYRTRLASIDGVRLPIDVNVGRLPSTSPDSVAGAYESRGSELAGHRLVLLR